MKRLIRLRLMPILVVVAALSFGVRFGDFVRNVSSPSAMAQPEINLPTMEGAENISQANTQEDLDTQTEQAASAPSATEEEPRTAPVGGTDVDKESPNWKDSSDSDIEFSAVRMELFEDLSARRKDLSSQERELAVREALLKAAEQEINQKYKELISLRSEIQDLLVEQSEEEKARVASLVKIYEGMKPKDAARIFNTLDMDVLLQVVSQMSERKSAPIIASMRPDRARNLTLMLMEQKSLPTLSENLM